MVPLVVGWTHPHRVDCIALFVARILKLLGHHLVYLVAILPLMNLLLISCLHFVLLPLILQDGLEVVLWLLLDVLWLLLNFRLLDTLIVVHPFVVVGHVGVDLQQEVRVYLEFNFRELCLVVLGYWGDMLFCHLVCLGRCTWLLMLLYVLGLF